MKTENRRKTMPTFLTQQLLLSCWILSSSTTTSFSPVQNSVKHDHLPSLFRPGPLYDSASGSDSKSSSNSKNTPLWATNKRRKKGKPSMSERLKRRQGKTKSDPDQFAHLRSANIDFSSKTDEDSSSSKVEGASIQVEQVKDPTAAAEKAKELLKAQRASVNMLTMVKERIMERLSDSDVRTELDEKGYAIVDDFFVGTTNNDGYRTTILTELQEEGTRMLQDGGMEVDTSNLGTGEYIIPIAGGEKQYITCPRIVEIVVSATKHVPDVFSSSSSSSDEESDSKCLDLDSSACMATLRTFDRKALKASMALLMGKQDDDVFDIPESTSPLKVITEGDDDQRKLSLYYYIVPDNWNENCGGGLEFESGVVHAKRDRLVVLFSDTTKCKTITWKGSDDSSDTMTGNSIELHLVNKRK
jgi:hypothetical protein